MDKVIQLAADSLDRPWPDLTIILDVDSATAATRLKKDLDRMEQKGSDYHKKVREGFLRLATKQENFTVIDAADDIEAVHKKVIETINKFGAK